MNSGAIVGARPMKARVLTSFFVAAAAWAGASCQSPPREIDGRKVIGTRWVDGKKVYLVDEAETDQAAMTSGAEEARKASTGVVFEPLK